MFSCRKKSAPNSTGHKTSPCIICGLQSAITLNETNPFRHTLREQGTGFGDKSGSKVNFTRVIIAKIPFIVGERASWALAVSVVLFCLHFYSEIVELHILRDVTMACLLLLSFAGYLSPNFHSTRRLNEENVPVPDRIPRGGEHFPHSARPTTHHRVYHLVTCNIFPSMRNTPAAR